MEPQPGLAQNRLSLWRYLQQVTCPRLVPERGRATTGRRLQVVCCCQVTGRICLPGRILPPRRCRGYPPRASNHRSGCQSRRHTHLCSHQSRRHTHRCSHQSWGSSRPTNRYLRGPVLVNILLDKQKMPVALCSCILIAKDYQFLVSLPFFSS